MTLCRQITKNGDKMIMADFALGLDEVSTRARQSRLKDRIAKCKAANRYCIVLYCIVLYCIGYLTVLFIRLLRKAIISLR